MKRHHPPAIEKVRAALACIPPDVGRPTRVRLAFAVWDAVGEAGAELWLSWAGQRSNPKPAEDRATWRSCAKPGDVKAPTLWGVAKDHGWRPDKDADQVPKLTPAELAAQRAARREAEERARREAEERQRQAAAEALALWERAADATDPAAAPYLLRKGVQPFGVRALPDGTLIVPGRTVAGELVNVQTIKPQRPTDGAPEKLFVRGARKSGTLHLIGEPEGARWLLVAEGYATAASVHQATGRPVAVAWDTSNLEHVVRALRGRYPAARLALCGDDDSGTEARTGKNPGRLKATEAARLAKGPAIFPTALPAGGSDFNDMAAAVGLDAVRELIEAALQAAEADAEASSPGRRTKAAPAGGGGPAQGGSDDDSGASGPRDRFRVDTEGLWFIPPDDGSGGAARPMRVCDPVRVIALARDGNDARAGLLVEFDAPFRRGRQWLLPAAMLAGEPRAWLSELYGMGFPPIADLDRRRLLAAFLQSRRPAELVLHVSRTGWHGLRYVLPEETLGEAEGERVIFYAEGGAEARFAQRGSLEQWRSELAAVCVGNSRPTFAVSVAFAGPLLAWAPIVSPGGFHFVGGTSTGKTTGLLLAASVWGKGSENDPESYLQKWRATGNGLEFLAEQHNDCTLILDELGQMDPAEAGTAAYMLSDGQGKNRSKGAGGLRQKPSWRLLFVSSGELTLAQHMESAGKAMKGGQEVRLIALPAEVSPGSCLETSRQFQTGHEVSEFVKRRAAKCYGTAGHAWLLWLVEHARELPERLRVHMESFATRYVRDESAGQVKRGARRFALAAAAGELATAAGLTGWPKGEAMTAAGTMFEAWIASRPGGIGDTEEATMLRQVRGWFGAHGDARFTDWARAADDHAPKTMHRAGWRKPIKTATGLDELTGWEWFTLADVFRAEVCKGFSERAVARLLLERGHLHVEGKRQGFTCKAKPPGAHDAMVYRVRSTILGDIED